MVLSLAGWEPLQNVCVEGRRREIPCLKYAGEFKLCLAAGKGACQKGRGPGAFPTELTLHKQKIYDAKERGQFSIVQSTPPHLLSDIVQSQEDHTIFAALLLNVLSKLLSRIVFTRFQPQLPRQYLSVKVQHTF